MFKTIRLLIVILLIVIAGIAAYTLYPRDDKYSTEKGVISNIDRLAKLCTVDIYREVVIVDTIGNKVICAIQKQQGSVYFDLDSLDLDMTGDTVRVILPPEEVVLNESVEPESWRVIDTHNIRLLGTSTFTAAEDNAVKTRAQTHAIESLYADGVVARARAEAVANLTGLLTQLTRRPVLVNDTTPAPKHAPMR